MTSEEDANLFFESLNARGKELAVSDLVKNRLYSESGRPSASRARTVGETGVGLGTGQSNPRASPALLDRQRKIDAEGFNVREKQLYRKVVETVKGRKAATLSLLADLASSAGHYAMISDYTLWPDEPAYDKSFEDTLSELRLFRVTQCNPVLLNAIQCFNRPKEYRQRRSRIVADFSFRYSIIGNQSPGNLERVSNGIAAGIRTGKFPWPERRSRTHSGRSTRTTLSELTLSSL